jgi:hypothetical protein
MSDEPESGFSGERRTISWERMSLGEANVEKTECLKSWYQGGFSRVEMKLVSGGIMFFESIAIDN